MMTFPINTDALDANREAICAALDQVRAAVAATPDAPEAGLAEMRGVIVPLLQVVPGQHNLAADRGTGNRFDRLAGHKVSYRAAVFEPCTPVREKYFPLGEVIARFAAAHTAEEAVAVYIDLMQAAAASVERAPELSGAC